MKKLLLLCFTALIVFGFQQKSETQSTTQPIIQATGGLTDNTTPIAFKSTQPIEASAPIAETELRAAATKAIKLMQHSQVAWAKKQVCTSCHHQLLPEITINLARERGVTFDETLARNATSAAFAYLKDLDAAIQGYDYIDVLFDGYALTSAAAIGVKPNLATSAYAQFIASRQLADGSWPTIDARPPQAHSPFTATAVCAQAIAKYLPDRLKEERESRLARAREWLTKTQPRTTEDRAFQLLGLLWTGASEDIRQKAARDILAQQREDGGWSQLPSMTSDAYATGEVLFALREGVNLPTSDAAYQRGLRFLLDSQKADGSWLVKSRLHPPAPLSPPYVDTEFPYQHDQFVSIMGTGWAVAAMLNALPALGSEKSKPPALDFAPAMQSEWARVALTGSTAELKKLLDKGMKPNARTAGGMTALMLAARDLEKVKLLIARGADVNARTASGVTPLMVAARHRGNVEVVRLLLKKGARPNAPKRIEVRNDASALFFAVMAGDKEIVEALLDAGARLDHQMKVLGQFQIRPLMFAAIEDDAALVEYLIERGAKPNDTDMDGITPLGWATLTNHAHVVEKLIARGAKVNHVDRLGMTPLLYAASIDFGDTAVIEKLIAAGADIKAKNKEGLTAHDLAKHYRHEKITSLLAEKSAHR